LPPQFFEVAFQGFKFLSGFAELAFSREPLVVGQISGGSVDEFLLLGGQSRCGLPLSGLRTLGRLRLLLLSLTRRSSGIGLSEACR
jgi:hypothetical protein